MDFIIVSGMSGSGKSIALHALEDLGYYCIDNLPAVLYHNFLIIWDKTLKAFLTELLSVLTHATDSFFRPSLRV